MVMQIHTPLDHVLRLFYCYFGFDYCGWSGLSNFAKGMTMVAARATRLPIYFSYAKEGSHSCRKDQILYKIIWWFNNSSILTFKDIEMIFLLIIFCIVTCNSFKI